MDLVQKRFNNAERQRRYREAHLGEYGDKAKIECFVDTETKRNLDFLARTYDCTLTETIEMLINDAC
jgi:hypothetical protein